MTTTTLPDLTAPYRLQRRAFFWQVQVPTNTTTALVRHGRLTAAGRPVVKHFDTHHQALDWARAAVQDKIDHGYSLDGNADQQMKPVDDLTEEQTSVAPRRSSRKRNAPQQFMPGLDAKKAKKEPKAQPVAAKSSPKRNAKPASKPTKLPRKKLIVSKVKRGLRGEAAVDTSVPLGVVDPAAKTDGAIHIGCNENGDDVVYDVMLVLFDKEKHHDKFIVLQLIEETKPLGFLLYERWGRTGTSGMSLETRFDSGKLDEALKSFTDKFKTKTGLDWEDREQDPVNGKYRFVKQDFESKAEMLASDSARWQYWVDDGVDGKSTGWYDYDEFGTSLAEQLYLEFQNNPWLTERIVASGMWSYLVNLATMTQTNIIHANHTCRNIRRVAPGEVPNNEHPTAEYPITTPSTTVAPASALNIKAKKPNVLPPNTKPAHKVEPAPSAVVPNAGKQEPRQDGKDEPEANTDVVHIVIPVDDMCPNSNDYTVVDDFDATLNQTNLMGGNNNNKYYRIQVLQHKKTNKFALWTRWGRVGESRGTQTKLQACKDRESCEKAFSKKFKDKTGNFWNNRGNFSAMVGKYELLEIDHTAKKEEDLEPLMMTLKNKKDNVEYLPSSLPDETRDLVHLLFEKDMYNDALKEFEIDVRKMPLGALSKDQIQKGISVLEELEEELKTSRHSRQELERLSSQFYTTIPRDFGRSRPPVIATQDMLQKCYDMCNVLLDMEKATSLMSQVEEDAEQQKEEQKEKLPHPTDAQYASLNAELRLITDGSEEYEVVSKAFHETKGAYEKSKLLNIWRVDRKGEKERFNQVKDLDNHYLLWHGSHIGAISSILATGLRIMKHSGGRVGRGIYLASENGKSQAYTTPESRKKIGCMFLAEAALGKISEILTDDSSLTKAPNGFDSVRACGRQTPAGFREVSLDDKKVKVPVEKPTENPTAKQSSFDQDEYLIYNEAQARIRYVITVKKENMY